MFIRQAITTKFIGPTNFRGSRISVRAAAGRMMVDYPHALNIEQAHAYAASLFAEKYRWHGAWFGGGLPSKDGYVFVNSDVFGSAPEGAAFVIVKTMEDML